MREQKCKQCSEQFSIREEDKEYYKMMSPVIGGEVLVIPEPTLCPLCRSQKRLAFRHQRKLYHRKCDLTGREMLSIFHPDSPHTVYYKDDWFSDQWDPMDYGRDFDFSRPFFEQFYELFIDVPQISLYQFQCENCEYINAGNGNKDLYLCFSVSNSEQSMYCDFITHAYQCLDCAFTNRSEVCYGCIDVNDCSRVFFSKDSRGCSDSAFLRNCLSCKNCIGCTGLKHKEYYVFNQHVGKEKFEEIWNSIFTGNRSDFDAFRSKFDSFEKEQPRPYMEGAFLEESTGHHLEHVKNAHQCFDSSDLEDCTYCSILFLGAKDCMDFDAFAETAERQFEVLSSGLNIYNNMYGMYYWNGTKNCLYSSTLTACSDCFGVVGLTHKQYCILNKQYTKEEYEALVPKIVAHMQKTGEWGQFFPPKYSPFPYNTSLVQDFFPLNKEKALAGGFTWLDEEEAKGGAPIPDALPEKEVVLTTTYQCSTTGKPFKILPQEYDVLKKFGIPLPNEAPAVRQRARMQQRGGRKLYERECMNNIDGKSCSRKVETIYPTETIYCKECFAECLG